MHIPTPELKTRKQSNKPIYCLGILILAGHGYHPSAQAVDDLLLAPNINLNQTQTNLSVNISRACSTGATLTGGLQDRCNNLVGATNTSGETSNLSTEEALQSLSPEQIIAPATQATRTTSGQVKLVGTTIQTRLQSLRTAALAADTNGSMLAGLTGGAAGIGEEQRLSGWLKANHHFGDVDSSFQQTGFDFSNWGFTAGADYHLHDDLVLGAAFTYQRSDSNFDRSGGGSESHSYTGSLYGTYYLTNGLYFDAVASYGGSDYDIERNINYTISTESVRTRLSGDPEGEQYSFSLGGGYDYTQKALTVTPFARVNYYGVQVDGYSESESVTPTPGWAQRFAEQNIQSLTSELGAQLSYAISTPHGVFVPQIRAEWLHEFKDSSRRIQAGFVNDPDNNTFSTVTEGPDRNYFIVGSSLSANLTHGLSAYFAYNALLGYRNIDSHQFTLGGRMAF